jgi:hypothetical protein
MQEAGLTVPEPQAPPAPETTEPWPAFAPPVLPEPMQAPDPAPPSDQVPPSGETE